MFDATPSTGGSEPTNFSLPGLTIADLASPNSASIAAYSAVIERTKELARNGGVQKYIPVAPGAVSLEEELYDSKAACKVSTSTISMHLRRDWRDALFTQLDALMDPENWEVDEPTVSALSYRTFLRLLLLKDIHRRPGLGAHEGDLIAAWTNKRDRLTIQCEANDWVSWSVSVRDTGEAEYAAGRCMLGVLMKRLATYSPERWFVENSKTEASKSELKTFGRIQWEST